jgi:arylsulfatase A-like enzyme
MSLSAGKALISSAFLVLAASSASSHLFAQPGQALLSGIVADAQGGGVASASLPVMNVYDKSGMNNLRTRRSFLQHVGALAAVANGAAADAAERKPNIVLLYADDLGYGDLSCYGATKIRTPNLDRLAAQGMRGTATHSASATCTPSRYALMTGEYAWRKEGTGVLPGDATLLIDPSRTTLPSMLKQAGYRTGVVGKWHMGLGAGSIDWNGEIKPGPLEIGFDYSFIMPATGDRVPCVYVENHRVVNLDPKDPISVSYDQPFPGEPTGKANPELLKMKPSHGHDMAIVNGVSRIGYMKGGKSALWVDEDMADTFTSKALAFVEREKAGPFFLYFATHDIHVPRLPNARFAGKSDMGARGDAILELDSIAGQVLDTLDRLKLTDDTIVMFGSDNGPVLDDGYKDQAAEKVGAHKPAGVFRGGKYSNYDGGTRVPFLIRWPNHIKPDTTSDALMCHVDLLHSLATLTGQKLPAGAAPDSFDLMQAFLGKAKKGRPYLVEHATSLALVEGDWKLIRHHSGPKTNLTGNELGNDPKDQLFHITKDPGERENLAEQEPERVKAMNSTLDGIQKKGRSRPD